MLDTIQMLGMPSEDTMKRLIQAGLELQFFPAHFAEMAAEGVEGNPPLMLGIDPVPHPLLSWADVAPQQAQLAAGGQIPSTDHIMQAVVQYNRRQLLAAAADPSPAAAAAAPAAPAATAAAASADGVTPEQPLLVVGYVMKPSREEALAKAGLLHLLPRQGMCFMPVDLDTLCTQQQQQQPHIEILLHKGSDELVPLTAGSADPAPSTAAAGDGNGVVAAASPAAVGVCWSPRLLKLQAWLAQHPSICAVDPFQHTAKVLDRLLLAQLLQRLHSLQLPGGVRARGPAFLEATCFDADLADAVAAAGLQPPFIVKPRVACGVAHSHSMALVLTGQGLQQLQGQVPAPALVQEFVNHGGQQYKAYVLGEQVFVTPRASIPDVHLDNPAWQQQPQQQQQCILFDSLASLPTQLPVSLTQQQQQQQDSSATAPEAGAQQPHPAAVSHLQQARSVPPEPEAVQAVAAFLRQQLGLTLFGFDIVVAQHHSDSSSMQQQDPQAQPGQQQQQQELVVIDVNYFPNYRGGTDTPAMFRAALRQAWQQHQQSLQRTQ